MIFKMLDEISSNLNQKVAAVNEADLFTYSAFTYEKLFSPSSDIYHRNVVKLSDMRKSELQKVVAKSLEYLNAKSNRNFVRFPNRVYKLLTYYNRLRIRASFLFAA